jgi:two-component system, cell cycle sensor histidine kinase and response regulator CckA
MGASSATRTARNRRYLLGALAVVWLIGGAIFIARLEMREIDRGEGRDEGMLRVGGLTLQLLIAVSSTTLLLWTLHERRLDRLQTQRSEEFRQLFFDASEAMFVVDGNLVLQEVNAAGCRMTGFARDEILGRSLLEMVSQSELQANPMRLADLRAGVKVVSERLLLRKDGSTALTEVAIQQLPDGRLLGVARDVSQRRALDELRMQLQQAQKMEALGRLAGGVSHDFNNLLGIILGYADLLASGLAEGAEGREELAEIRKAVLRAAELTHQLLAFSRRQVLEVRVVDLGALLEDSRKMLARLLPESIELKLEVAQALWSVRADSTQLVQVLVNLAVNARDAMPLGGQLEISADNCALDEVEAQVHGLAVGDFVRVRVADTGHGMTADVIDHAFEPFFTTKAAAGGTGLGLATVYGIVQQLDGCVEIDSSPTRGTTVSLFLPRVLGDASGERALPPVPSTEPVRATVLVVEDLAPLRKLVERMVRQIGYRVYAAASAQEALTLAEGGMEIDVLLSDIVMPGMDGRDLARLMKAVRPRLRIVLMTGYSELFEETSDVHELGVDAVVQKPFSRAQIESVLADVLAGSEIDGDVS